MKRWNAERYLILSVRLGRDRVAALLHLGGADALGQRIGHWELLQHELQVGGHSAETLETVRLVAHGRLGLSLELLIDAFLLTFIFFLARSFPAPVSVVPGLCAEVQAREFWEHVAQIAAVEKVAQKLLQIG